MHIWIVLVTTVMMLFVVKTAKSAEVSVTMTRVSKPSCYYWRGRDAGTGRYIKVTEANKRPATTVVERVRKPNCR